MHECVIGLGAAAVRTAVRRAVVGVGGGIPGRRNREMRLRLRLGSTIAIGGIGGSFLSEQFHRRRRVLVNNRRLLSLFEQRNQLRLLVLNQPRPAVLTEVVFVVAAVGVFYTDTGDLGASMSVNKISGNSVWKNNIAVQIKQFDADAYNISYGAYLTC